MMDIIEKCVLTFLAQKTERINACFINLGASQKAGYLLTQYKTGGVYQLRG